MSKKWGQIEKSLEKITFKTVGPVWVKLRKSVIFIKDTVFWGKLVSVGSLMVLAKDRTK
jgi:hypothetical protein